MKSDQDLKEFIHYERLEEDYEHVRRCIDAWIDGFHALNMKKCVTKSMKIHKELFMNEVKRWSKFLYAIVLNDPEYMDDHEAHLRGMIDAAGKISTEPGCLLPWIAFGQCPLPGSGEGQLIRLQFVIDSSLNMNAMIEAMKKMEDMFDSVKNSTKEAVAAPDLHSNQGVARSKNN